MAIILCVIVFMLLFSFFAHKLGGNEYAGIWLGAIAGLLIGLGIQILIN